MKSFLLYCKTENMDLILARILMRRALCLHMNQIPRKERRDYAIYIFGKLGIGPVRVMEDIILIIMIRRSFMYRNWFFFIILNSILKYEFLRLFGLVLIVRLKLFSMKSLQYILSFGSS